jgi:hypothetical protein
MVHIIKCRVLMSVGVMTVGVMRVGEITVGVMTVGVMTVGVMRRPQLFIITLDAQKAFDNVNHELLQNASD